MRSLSIKLTALLITIANLSVAAVYLPNELSTVRFETSDQSKMVKATIVDGELMPVVDLPMIEITATARRAVYLPVFRIGDQFVAAVQLPEILIEENRIKSDMNTSELPIATVDLPVVEITSHSKKDKMYPVKWNSKDEIIVLASIPEITVYGYAVEYNVSEPLFADNVRLYKMPTQNNKCEFVVSRSKSLVAFSNMGTKGLVPVNVELIAKKKGITLIISNEKYFIPAESGSWFRDHENNLN